MRILLFSLKLIYESFNASIELSSFWKGEDLIYVLEVVNCPLVHDDDLNKLFDKYFKKLCKEHLGKIIRCRDKLRKELDLEDRIELTYEDESKGIVLPIQGKKNVKEYYNTFFKPLFKALKNVYDNVLIEDVKNSFEGRTVLKVLNDVNLEQ